MLPKMRRSPHLGFPKEDPHANLRRRIISNALARVQRRLHTSTPLRDIMEFSFPKYYEQASTAYLQGVDTDSGYTSHTQESNSETASSLEMVASDPIYISEDALQEKPRSAKKEAPNQVVYDEFSHLYYLNSIVDASVSTVKSSFSGFQDSEESAYSDNSPVLHKQPPIIIGNQSINTFNLPLCETNDTSNIENNCNVANVQDDRARKRKRSVSKTPTKRREPSPDLFSDEEITSFNSSFGSKLDKSKSVVEEKYLLENDKCLHKRVSRALSGVLPPPSVTTVHMTVDDMLEKIKSNVSFFWGSRLPPDAVPVEKSKLVNTDLATTLVTQWPDILECRHHGLHYNCNKLSEEMETLYSKYSQRYVGAETQSTCSVFLNLMSSPSKRKANKLRWMAKSPGRRLSHLARRRITFSSANLQAGGAAATSNAHSRQIMIDAKRFDLLSRKPSPRKRVRTPRKTPRKSPRKQVKTPTSSLKKQMAFRMRAVAMDEAEPGPSSSSLKASATKRALFQSPDGKIKETIINKIVPSTSNPSLSPWKKRPTPKRALFCSPSKGNSPLKGKRKRNDSEDCLPSKIARSMSMQVEGSKPMANKMPRIKSELSIRAPAAEMSDHHKQKLRWAVHIALRDQNINDSHPKFKQTASILARVVRRIFSNQNNSSDATGGTSERMLRIAKQHVFSASKGTTVEEIVHTHELNRLRPNKPTGYISKDDAKAATDVAAARNKTVFQDKANTINSYDKDQQVRPAVQKTESKVDRVRKIINFDDDSSLCSFRF